MQLKNKLYLFYGLIGINLFLDQFTKIMAKVILEPNTIYPYFFDIIRLILVHNTGVAYSFGSDWPEHYRFIVFNLVVTVILGVLFWYVLKFLDEITLLRVIGFSFVISGGLGNLIDRYLRDGAVVDFLNIGFGGLRTAIFNWADICITIGIFLILTFALIEIFTTNKQEPNNVS